MRTARPSPDPSRRLALARLLVAALALLGGGLLARPALAAGTVTITDRQPKEDDGRWKLKMSINYGGTPHLAHIPMLFSFTHTMNYERALTDQSPEKPVLVRTPLQGQQAINESMDVGFSDGTGKIFNITKFDFVIRRDRGFEAGEYDLKITRASDGVQMGQVQKLTLQGENPIIDRRAIVFTGEKKKKAPEEKSGNEAASADKTEKTGEEPAASEEPPAGDGAGDAPIETPPAVEPQAGGCGCRVAAEDAPGALIPLAAAALGALALRRRRARRARRD